MSICTRVVVSITFHQVDYAPDTKTGTDCNDQCLKDIDCTAKKSHNQMCEQTLFLMVCKRLALLLSLLFRPFCILISSSRVLEFFLSYQSSPSSASITDTSSCVTVTSYISNSVSSDITSRCARYFSTSNALFLLKSASSLYRLCFVMSY